MSNKIDNGSLVETVLMAAVATAFGISAMYLPLFSTLVFLIPVIFLIVGYRQGTKNSLISLVIFALLTGVFSDFVYSTYLVALFGPVAIAMSSYLQKEKEPFYIIGAGAIASMLSTLMLFTSYEYVGGVNLLQEIISTMETLLKDNAGLFESLDTTVVNTDALMAFFKALIPGVLVLQSLIIAIANYYLSAAILKKVDPRNLSLPQFSEFKLPENFAMGAFIIFALSYLTKFMEGIHSDSLNYAVMITFIFLFFVQGVSVISFLLKKARLSNILRTLAIGVIFIVSPLLTAVSFVGLVDTIIDIRKIESKK